MPVMKKQVIFRLCGVGFLHAVLYLFFVPFWVYPGYGTKGVMAVVVFSIILTVLVLFFFKDRRQDKGV